MKCREIFLDYVLFLFLSLVLGHHALITNKTQTSVINIIDKNANVHNFYYHSCVLFLIKPKKNQASPCNTSSPEIVLNGCRSS